MEGVVYGLFPQNVIIPIDCSTISFYKHGEARIMWDEERKRDGKHVGIPHVTLRQESCGMKGGNEMGIPHVSCLVNNVLSHVTHHVTMYLKRPQPNFVQS